MDAPIKHYDVSVEGCLCERCDRCRIEEGYAEATVKAKIYAIELGRTLKLRRERAGLLAKHVAERAGLSKGAYSEFESGTKPPTKARLNEIINAIEAMSPRKAAIALNDHKTNSTDADPSGGASEAKL